MNFDISTLIKEWSELHKVHQFYVAFRNELITLLGLDAASATDTSIVEKIKELVTGGTPPPPPAVTA